MVQARQFDLRKLPLPRNPGADPPGSTWALPSHVVFAVEGRTGHFTLSIRRIHQPCDAATVRRGFDCCALVRLSKVRTFGRACGVGWPRLFSLSNSAARAVALFRCSASPPIETVKLGAPARLPAGKLPSHNVTPGAAIRTIRRARSDSAPPACTQSSRLCGPPGRFCLDPLQDVSSNSTCLAIVAKSAVVAVL